MTPLVRRMSRRAFFSPARATQVEAEEITPEGYGELVGFYRAGRFVEIARRAGSRGVMELREAQRRFLDTLPPSNVLEGFRGRLAAALVHAEAVAHFGWTPNSEHRLFREPVDQIPREWVRGIPDHLREEALTAWGEEGASDFGKLVWREVVLSMARLRLARMDLLAASRVLEGADPQRDPALAWQLAAVWAVRARYVREKELWPDVRNLFREADSRQFVTPEIALNSSRTVARAMGDPDDLNLRLALVALGQGREGRADDRLREVRNEPAHLLRVPRLMLLGETSFARDRLPQAVANFREAADLAPDAHAVVAALVAALEARGQWDEAAALASEQLGLRGGTRPWSDFLITWAKPREPEQFWLRELVAV